MEAETNHLNEKGLLKSVHLEATLPEGELVACEVVRGDYNYWHYGCDNVDDRGWGCGYRTLQTLASWILLNRIDTNDVKFNQVPSLLKIQESLVELEDKPSSFLGSRDWIGSFEVCLVLDHLFNVPCKIVNVSSGTQLKSQVPNLMKHFDLFGSPVMMGGDVDASSKGIFGVCTVNNKREKEETFLLVVDPHFWKSPKGTQNENECQRMRHTLRDENWVEWKNLKEFMKNSFYNLCLPQMKRNKPETVKCSSPVEED